jgi:hypothetical protein
MTAAHATCEAIAVVGDDISCTPTCVPTIAFHTAPARLGGRADGQGHVSIGAVTVGGASMLPRPGDTG